MWLWPSSGHGCMLGPYASAPGRGQGRDSMGTRGFVGVVVGGEVKIGYNHFDSYPEELGKNTYRAVQRWQDGGGGEIEHRLGQARALKVVDTGTPPTAEQRDELAKFADLSVGDRSLTDWYCLLRNTQGDIDAILDCGYLEDAGDFPLDSLFCEWGYLVDFDQRRFEVYEGFRKEPPARGRWAHQRGDRDPLPTGDTYHPVELIADWPLGALPATLEEFLETVKKASRYADE